jgi:lipopolysaccharide export system permease protein
MTLIERYLFKNAFIATFVTLTVLAGVVWLSQAVREFDLVTTKGQSLIIFLTVTGLSFPSLISIIAPVSLFIAVLYTLNRLNGDSELIVMSATGLSPFRLLFPFVALSLIVAALVAVLTLWIMPQSFMILRDVVTKIRADVVSNIVREGQFTQLDKGIIFHFREKSGPALMGIFIQDRRDPDKTAVYVAERGQTIETSGQSYLLLENGSVQRENNTNPIPQIVSFQRYAFDLSQFNSDIQSVYTKPRERTTWQLFNPPENENLTATQMGRIRAELHDRITAPLYALAFGMIGFAALGVARTTRQGRGLAMAAAVIGVVTLRIGSFALSSLMIRFPILTPLAYILPISVSVLAVFIGCGGQSLFAKPVRSLHQTLATR